MTLFGKILVLANFGLSVVIMVGAMVLYFDRVDWTEGPVKPEEKWGELRKRNERVKDAWEFIRLADLRWRDVRGEVLDEEGYRAADRPWYEAELKHDREQATEQKPARTVIYDNGVLVVEVVANEPKHYRPKMVAAKLELPRKNDKDPPIVIELGSLKSYNEAEAKLRDDLLAQQKEFIDQLDKHKELSNRLTPESGKGLRIRIEDEKVKVKRLEEELAILRTLRVNTQVDIANISLRDKQLADRIKELKASLGLTVKQP